MASKLILILLIAVVICQATCNPAETSTKTKLGSTLTSAKSKISSTSKSVKNKITESATTGAVKASVGASSAKKQISNTASDLKGVAGLKRDTYAEELFPEGEELQFDGENTIEPEDIYDYVEEHYPHLRSLFEELFLVEPEDDKKPEPKPDGEPKPEGEPKKEN